MKVRELAISFIGTVIRIVILAVIIYGIINVGKKAYDFGYRVFTEEPMAEAPGRDISVSVANGDSTTDIAKMLEEKGLCRDWMLFYIQSKLSEYKDDIMPGNYTLNTSMTADEMLMALQGIELEDDELDTIQSDESIDSKVSNPGADALINSAEQEEGEYSAEETLEDVINDENGEGPQITIEVSPE